MNNLSNTVTDLFGIPNALNPVSLGDGSHPHTPKKIDGYVFRRELVRNLLAFENSDMYAMGLIGHAGCGKSTAIEQFYAYRGLPVLKAVGTRTATADDFMGSYHPSSDGLKWVDRSLAIAMKQGLPFFIDEYNNLTPETTTALNAVFEGRSYTIEATGEVLHPAKGFKVFAAMNEDNGLGVYQGRLKQDNANLDRFLWVRVPYPSFEEETVILNRILLPAFKDDAIRKRVCTSMVNVANKLRKQFVGDEQNGGDTLETVLSTRSLVRWATLSIHFSTSPEKFRYSFDLAFGNGPMPQSNREAIHTICSAEMGADLFPLPT